MLKSLGDFGGYKGKLGGGGRNCSLVRRSVTWAQRDVLCTNGLLSLLLQTK